MGSIADELATIPYFRRVQQRELAKAAGLWTSTSLAPGEVMWAQGEAVAEIGVLIFGELAALVDGHEVGRVLPPEIIGEASAFFAGSQRSATLRAKKSSQMLTLPVTGLRTLRWQRSALYEALLEQALLALVRRVRATDLKIAQVARGDAAAPARSEPSALVRLWKALRPGGPTTKVPSIEPLLLQQPGLRDLSPEDAEALASAFVPEPMSEGQIVFLEGDEGSAMYVVADGQIDVLRHVRGERAELLASLRAGHQFGANTLVEKGARTASCVASTPGWLYRMDAEAFSGLKGNVRLVWRESVLATLATQIRNANAALNKASGGSRTSAAREDGFKELLKASGYLEGLRVDDAQLDQMEVVIDEDQKRNPKNRR